MLPDTGIDDVKKQRNVEYAKHINDPVLSSLKKEGIRLLFFQLAILLVGHDKIHMVYSSQLLVYRFMNSRLTESCIYIIGQKYKCYILIPKLLKLEWILERVYSVYLELRNI
jgi:hypothetical protein